MKEPFQFNYFPLITCIMIFLSTLLMLSCQSGNLVNSQKIYPEKTTSITIQHLNQIVSERNFSKLYPDGVQVKAFVVSYYKGGPVNKEIIGLSSQKPQLIKTDYSEVQPSLFCGRETGPSDLPVKVGDEVMIAGFLYSSSVQDNIFLEKCQVIP